ncbi:MAG: hypothetical protein ACYTEP_06980 [Planctomycetota bacterium]|jgi:hypothetical protein
MSSTLLSPYFLAGLLAVVFFFLTAALVGLSLFAAPSGKKKLLRAESVAMLLVLGFMTWLCLGMWEDLQALLRTPEPAPMQLGDWGRRTASLLLLGLSLVFASLVGCFGWVRAGFAGNGVRMLVWSFLCLKVVTASVSLLDLLSRAQVQGEGAIPSGDLAGVAAPILDEISADILFWIPTTGVLLLVSLAASLWLRRR